LDGGSYAFDSTVALPDPAALDPSLPPLHDVAAGAHLADGKATQLTLRVGSWDLGNYAPGVVLTDLTADAASPDAPTAFHSNAQIRGAAFTLTATLPPVAQMRSGEIALRDLSVAGPPVEAAGDLVIRTAAHPVVTGTINAKRLDADALAQLFRTPVFRTPAPASPATAPAGVAPSPPPPPAAPQTRLLSDAPLPLAALRAADLDLALSVADLRAGNASARNVSGHLVVRDGRLDLDSVTGELPGGRIEAALSLAPDGAALRAQSSNLALAGLTGALGLPGDLSGNADLDIDLKGMGASPRALAASAEGHVGAAMVDGEIANRVLVALADKVVRGAKLPDTIGGADRTKLRCLALRADVAHGTADVTSLVLDTSRLLLQGTGTVQLGDESLNLQLRPMLRIGGPNLVFPAHVGGNFTDPKVALDSRNAVGAAAALLAGERGGDACPAALAAARFGRPGPAAAAPSAPEAQSQSGKIPNAAQLLRGLLR
jgi:AsmA protein